MIKNKTKSQKALGRRKFVKKALLATGATALGASGLAAPAVTAERIHYGYDLAKKSSRIRNWSSSFCKKSR
jgi:hypothetical protein